MKNMTLFQSLKQPDRTLLAITCLSEHLRTGISIADLMQRLEIDPTDEVVSCIEQLAAQPIADQYGWMGTLAETCVATASETLPIAV